MASPSHLSPMSSHANAVSTVAATLSETLSGVFAATSSVITKGPESVMNELLDAIAKAAEDGIPVTPEAYERAFCLLSALPPKFPRPQIVVESDGEIGLDWDHGPRRFLSVSVGDSAMLGYAALVGPEPTHGRVAFAGAFPPQLTFLLRRI